MKSVIHSLKVALRSLFSATCHLLPASSSLLPTTCYLLPATCSLLLATFSLTATAQSFTLYGTVINDEKEPIEFALIHIEGQNASAFTDLKGKYTLTAASTDSVVVVFQFLGYQTRKRVLNNPEDTVRLDVMLPRLGIELEEVQVKDIRRQTTQMTDVNINEMKHMGNASGGGIEQIIATQAGVSTHNELSNQYNVRGGSFDENSVYINGVEMYRPLLVRSGQQEGLSVINPDMVERVGFSAGGFEARYGDKMSSVLDITYKKVKHFEGSVSASLLGASGYVGIGNEKFSWTNAVRYKTMKNLLGSMDTQGEYDPRDFDYQTYLSWSPSKRWTLDFIGNISRNDYNFVPEDRETKFGTSTDTKYFKVYFDGQEKDKFYTYFGNMSLTHNFNTYNSLTLSLSAFQTYEQENFDLQGQYWLSSSEDATESLGIGTYLQHARNRLKATVRQAGLSGHNRFTGHDLRYGLLLKHEEVEERMREWEMRDSAGYSLPHTGNTLNLIYNLTSDDCITSNRFEMYAQDTWRHEYPEGELIINYGARLSHWDLNGETLFSPRATVSFVPAKNDNLVFRFSTGLYYQAPFYKELKDTVTVNGNTRVQLNKDIKSQRSVHFVLGGEYKFRMNNRPFKATAEVYYKALSDINPYNVDNVRVVYLGQNCASGYAMGLDMKIYGEFVPGTDSWVSIGLMKTEEKINGIWSPRPTDQRFNLGAFFSDYFPGSDRWKVSIKGHYAGGLPFTSPHGDVSHKPYRFPAYKRVDLGISYCLLKGPADNGLLNQGGSKLSRYLKDIWVGLDAFNILDINNTNSFYWVTDVTGNQFAVPNYLTGRTLNLRLLVDF